MLKINDHNESSLLSFFKGLRNETIKSEENALDFDENAQI